MAIVPSTEQIRDGAEQRTLEIGQFTVFENKVGVWSGWAEKRSDVFSRYLQGDATLDDYFEDMHRRFGCSDMVRTVSGLDADTTLEILPSLSPLGGLELAETLRKQVQAEVRRRRPSLLRRTVSAVVSHLRRK